MTGVYRVATLAEVLAAPPLLDDEGWLVHPDFLRIDGVPAKTYTQANSGLNGLAGHSVVGEEADFLDGVPNRFLSMEMVAPGRFSDYAAASCMFILRKRMRHVVMYPEWGATWTSGSGVANTTTWAFEGEGGLNPHSEPLIEHQIRGCIVIATAWEQHKRRRLDISLLNEHRQLVARYGGGATACASGRYAQAFARIAAGERYIPEEAGMTADEINTLIDERIAEAIGNDNEKDVQVATFRDFLRLAVNGGEGAFTDLEGKPLPLIRDADLVARVEALETAKPGAPGKLPERIRITGDVTLEEIE